MRTFLVHHNPNSGRYTDYLADPTDALASAKASLEAGECTWVAGNCRKRMRAGDRVLFKFGGARLKQKPGVYFAGHVTRAPRPSKRDGVWRFSFGADRAATTRLLKKPIVGRALEKLAPRSYGASIQEIGSGTETQTETKTGIQTETETVSPDR